MATFSTGIDSKCFQVSYQRLKYWLSSPITSRLEIQHMQFTKAETESEDDVPYGYGFFHFVFAMGAMYFAMLFIGWNAHKTMQK